MKYADNLIKLGVAATRVESIAEAMRALHNAICPLDFSGQRAFNKMSINQHLDMFEQEEELRLTAHELYKLGIKKAVKHIDWDDFPDFADKLNYMLEEAVELEIPGAAQLFTTINDLRKVIGPRGSLFKRLARWAENVSNIHGVSPRRLKYTTGSTYDFTEEVIQVGLVSALIPINRKEDELGESGYRLQFVRVSREHDSITTEDVRKALKHVFSITSCGHPHDCCGCFREHVYGLKYLATNFYDEEIWVLRIHFNKVV